MMRFLVTAALSLIVLSGTATATESTLKSAVIVESRFIKLGDLFSNAGDKATTNIAYAPAPGKRLVLDATWLYRVARGYRLKWRPLTMNTRAVVERASQEIMRDEIEDVLISALRDRGVKDKVELAFGGRTRLFVAANQAVTIGVEGLTYDQVTGRFVATVSAPAGEANSQRLRISGRVHHLVSVPIATHRMRRGEVIRKGDIEMIDVRANNLRPGTIIYSDQLIGMAAKRVIRPRVPIRTSQIRRPLLVPKGSLVTILLQTSFMRLTVLGRALDEGSKGEVVRVKNSHSKQMVEATVIGPGRVSVNRPGLVALN